MVLNPSLFYALKRIENVIFFLVKLYLSLERIFFINIEYFVANFKDGGDTITQQNHIGHGTDEKTTYITVETREGKLQQLKINLDDENFSTSTSILEYLVEKGEINPKSLSVSQELGKHRKSFNAISKQDAV